MEKRAGAAFFVNAADLYGSLFLRIVDDRFDGSLHPVLHGRSAWIGNVEPRCIGWIRSLLVYSIGISIFRLRFRNLARTALLHVHARGLLRFLELHRRYLLLGLEDCLDRVVGRASLSENTIGERAARIVSLGPQG